MLVELKCGTPSSETAQHLHLEMNSVGSYSGRRLTVAMDAHDIDVKFSDFRKLTWCSRLPAKREHPSI
jgi:hypothetical protein